MALLVEEELAGIFSTDNRGVIGVDDDDDADDVGPPRDDAADVTAVAVGADDLLLLLNSRC